MFSSCYTINIIDSYESVISNWAKKEYWMSSELDCNLQIGQLVPNWNSTGLTL